MAGDASSVGLGLGSVRNQSIVGSVRPDLTPSLLAGWPRKSVTGMTIAAMSTAQASAGRASGGKVEQRVHHWASLDAVQYGGL